MDYKTKRMLQLLDKQVKECNKCIIKNGGLVKPYGTEYSKYIMIGEAPDEFEVEEGESLTGIKGKMFWNIMAEHQLTKREFLILNTVQCRVVKKGNKTGKPSQMHRNICKKGIEKYVKVLKPEKIILMGNFAINNIMGDGGIDDFYKNDEIAVEANVFGHKTTVIKSCLPGAIAYEKGREKDLRRSIDHIRG